MSANVKFFWETPIDPVLVKSAWEKAFFQEVGTKFWKDQWNWRYCNNPISKRVYAAYILYNDVVASFVAFCPVIIKQRENYMKAALGVSGFTHPDRQGKGYYSHMYRALIDQMSGDGFEALIGFDNHNSHYPEVKYLGWRDIGLLTTFSLDCINIKKITCDTSDKNISDVELSDGLLNTLAGFYTNNAQFHIERSFEYLKWRLMDNPINSYRAMVLTRDNAVIAAIIYKRYGSSELDIMESFFREEGESEMFDSYCILLSGLAKSEGISQLNIWSQLRSSEHLFLEKIGFTERGFSTYFVCRPLSVSNKILDIRNWHYRFMDSDVY